MENLDYESALGISLWLLSQSEYHKNWSIHDVDLEIIPALIHEQFRIYFDEQQNPVGLATWAWLSDAAKSKVLNNQGALEFEEWESGEHLMFNDYIAPWGHAKAILKDLRSNVFPNETAFSLGRNPDGSIRKVYQWKGKGVKDKVVIA